MTISRAIRFVVAGLLGAALFACTTPSAGLPSASAGALGSSASPVIPSFSQPAAVVASPAATSGLATASSGPAVSSVADTPAASPRPTSRPAASPDATGLVTITTADEGSTIEIAVGQRLLVELGTGLDWTVTVTDPLVLALVPRITIVRGAQGLYVGKTAGSATITAVGDPACRKSSPPCMAPSRLVSVTVNVR